MPLPATLQGDIKHDVSPTNESPPQDNFEFLNLVNHAPSEIRVQNHIYFHLPNISVTNIKISETFKTDCN
jgi:hypothetical protein